MVSREWRRIALLSLIGLAVLLMFAPIYVKRTASVAPEPMVEVEPLFKFGDDVMLVKGFYRGTHGKVVGWRETTCDYTIRTDLVLIEGVPEDDLAVIREVEELDDLFAVPET